jgi:Tfp pilus assembly protein FimT
MLYVLIAVLAVLIFLCLPGFGQTARGMVTRKVENKFGK